MKLFSNYLKYAFFLLALGLSACGFHLKGLVHIPTNLKKIYVQSDSPNSDFTQILERLLIANQIQVVSDPAEANVILTLSDISSTDGLTSLNGGAQAGQYHLYAHVNFSVTEVQTTKVVIPETQVDAMNTFTSNSTQALSAQGQINQMMKDLKNELASDILSQLLEGHQKPNTSTQAP